jgi:hypothetical protein
MIEGHGLQTQDFINRLEKSRQTLPPLILELAQIMREMVERIESPQIKDIVQLHEQLRQLIGIPQKLGETCGSEGLLCGQCPFGAYLPSGFPYASEQKPLCLPWISLTQPKQ